jgi:protein arginine kinase activator
MICEVCHQKNADIVFKTVTGNQVATKAMCMSCAYSMQQDMIKMFMALGFRQDQVEEHLDTAEPQQTMPRFLCTHCGRSFEQLDENSMAGCASCYEAMQSEMDKYLKDSKQVIPQSEMPGQPEEESTVAEEKDSLLDLKYKMIEAVVNEEYEEAAQLRDQINHQAPAEKQA